jgi:cell division control protein 6
VAVIAELDGEQAGDIYETFQEKTGLGYTRYSEIINKLDQLGVIDATYSEIEGRGRSRELSLNYDADAVLERI